MKILTSVERKLKPSKLRKIKHFVQSYVSSGDLGWKTAQNYSFVILMTFTLQCSDYFSWAEAVVELFMQREDCKISNPRIPIQMFQDVPLVLCLRVLL